MNTEAQAWEDAANDDSFQEEMKEIAATYDVEFCDSCGGDFSVEKTRITCYNDSQLQDHPFESSEIYPTQCDIDGWMKIEHDLERDFVVHESCFNDHDDILVRV